MEPIVIGMRMGDKQSVDRFAVKVPTVKPLDVGEDPLVDKLGAGEVLVFLLVEPLPRFIHQGHTDIDNDSAPLGFDLYGGPADLMGTAMDQDIHNYLISLKFFTLWVSSS